MRCRSRDGPCGSHQLDARALKCETSVGSTVELPGLWCLGLVCEKFLVAGLGVIVDLKLTRVCETFDTP